MNNTMNAKPKGYCDVDHKTGNVATKLASTAWTQRRWYNNRVDCETEGFVWYVDQDYQDWCFFRWLFLSSAGILCKIFFCHILQ